MLEMRLGRGLANSMCLDSNRLEDNKQRRLRMSTVIETIDERRTDTITLTINDKEVNAKKGSTVLEAALNAGIYIPTLCYAPDLKPYGPVDFAWFQFGQRVRFQ